MIRLYCWSSSFSVWRDSISFLASLSSIAMALLLFSRSLTICCSSAVSFSTFVDRAEYYETAARDACFHPAYGRAPLSSCLSYRQGNVVGRFKLQLALQKWLEDTSYEEKAKGEPHFRQRYDERTRMGWNGISGRGFS